MANRFGQSKHQMSGGAATPPPRQNWGLIIGGVVVVLGMLIFLINLPGHNATPSPASTPIIVRDGLVVTGTGPELYIFKKYTLHQLISPTLTQQAQAQPVADNFLAQYAHGQPVDQNGLPVSQATVGNADSQPRSTQLPRAIPPAATPNHPLRWLGGMVVLAGGVWLLAYLFRRYQTDHQPHLKAYLQQTTVYTAQIEQILKASPNRQQQQLLTQIHHWQQAIEELVQSIAKLRQNDLIYRDSASVPAVIADLKRQLEAEPDPTLHTHLGHMLTQRESQLVALEQLQTSIRQAEIQVETTVAVLGTIYSQLLTNQSTSQVADYNRLLVKVDEEVHCLQDHLDALREVKMNSLMSF